MALAEFAVDARLQDGVAILDLRGDVDGMSAEPLNAAYARAIESDPRVVVLNFDNVGYINSTGIAVVVGILAQARRQGRSLVAYGLSDHYRTIFEVTRIADFIDLYTDESSALAGAKKE